MRSMASGSCAAGFELLRVVSPDGRRRRSTGRKSCPMRTSPSRNRIWVMMDFAVAARTARIWRSRCAPADRRKSCHHHFGHTGGTRGKVNEHPVVGLLLPFGRKVGRLRRHGGAKIQTALGRSVPHRRHRLDGRAFGKRILNMPKISGSSTLTIILTSAALQR